MKTTSRTLLVIIIAVPGILLAQTKDAAKPDPASEKAVLKAEQDCSNALTTHNAGALEAMLADSFYFVSPDGSTQNKAQFVADVKTGALKLDSNQLSDMKVQAADADMAVVTYHSNDKGTYNGTDISGEFRWTDVLVKRDGRWQFVAGQGTAIAKKPAQ